MGEYAESTRVATGPVPTMESYWTWKDRVRALMMSADQRSPYTHPDRADAFIMNHLVGMSSRNTKKPWRKS